MAKHGLQQLHYVLRIFVIKPTLAIILNKLCDVGVLPKPSYYLQRFSRWSLKSFRRLPFDEIIRWLGLHYLNGLPPQRMQYFQKRLVFNLSFVSLLLICISLAVTKCLSRMVVAHYIMKRALHKVSLLFFKSRIPRPKPIIDFMPRLRPSEVNKLRILIRIQWNSIVI